MTREETLEAIKVMQHYADGGEVISTLKYPEEWYTNIDPRWNWDVCDYRIKKATKKIRLFAYYDGEELRWTKPGGILDGVTMHKRNRVVRIPSEDKWVEVEE